MHTVKKTLRNIAAIPLAYWLCVVFSVALTVPAVFLIFRHSARNDLRQLQLNLEARLEKYHSALRNSRWALTRFAFLGDHVIDQNKKLLESVESILLPGFSFDSQSDYFFLRDLQGNTKLETIRGALVTRHSRLNIPNEKELIGDTERVIVSSCTINDLPYLCLLNTPDARSYLSESILYVSVGAIAPENLSVLAGATDIFRNSIFEPGFPQFHFNKPEMRGVSSRFDQVSEAGVNFWISISYPWKSFLFLSTLISLLISLISISFIYFLRSSFQRKIRLALEMEALKNQTDYYKSISSIARGVIHDINSPLCALKFLASNEKDVERKGIFDLLIKRVRLIVTDLEEKVAGSAPKTLIHLPLDEILRSIVNEKQSEYADSVKIHLLLESDSSSCVRGVYSDFCRMLSNIINNAVQAQCTEIRIKVLRDSSDEVIVSVSDNGQGISSENINSIFADGVSIGKKGGTGFGLFHAKSTVAKMNGKIQVESSLNNGTVLSITLPLAETPKWMMSILEVPKNGSLIIVDDEESVHSLIRKKLENVRGKISIESFNHPSAVPDNIMRDNRNSFIVDWNFGNEFGVGEELCEKLPHKRTLLFTSEWNIDVVQQQACSLGVKLLGKEFMDSLEVRVT